MKLQLSPIDRTIALLMVEDEQAPRKLMAANVERAWPPPAKPPIQGYSAYIDIAIRWIRTRPFDVLSLDMHMPLTEGSAIHARTGIRFSSSPVSTTVLSKPLVFSATIEVENAKNFIGEALQVAGASIDDKYAKSGTTASPTEDAPFEALTYFDWAKRVRQYVETPQKAFESPGGTRLSAAGHWLKIGQRVLPPALARHVSLMDRYWDDTTSPPVEAAHRFIEICERLALAQTAVVLQAALPGNKTLQTPNVWQRKGVQESLAIWRKNLLDHCTQQQTHWNWLNWLTDTTLAAMTQARELRNHRAHGLTVSQPQHDWRQLYPALRCVMDMASYWATHPLCMEFRIGRDSARAQWLASTQTPLPQRELDPDIEIPREAESDASSCWQPVWYSAGNGQAVDENTPPRWTSAMVSWSPWILRDSAGAIWLKLWSKPGMTEWLDLVSGDTRRDNAP